MTLDGPFDAVFAPSSPTVGSIAAALAKAQGAVGHAAKTNINPATKSKYADLVGILDAARAPLAENALAVVQAPYHLPGDPPTIVLVTTVLHESGEWLRSVMPVNARKMERGGEFKVADDMQTIGSAITYARRYALAAMLGIGQEDDDGNHASGRTRATSAEKAPPRAAPAVEAASAGEAAPWASGAVEDPFATMASAPQLKKLAIVLKEQGLSRDDALGFFSWLVKRVLTSSKEITKDEASRVLSWTGDQWGNALADYAVSLEGGPPDVSDLGAVTEERPIEFDPTGSVSRQAKRGVVS
jgi:hypothetical protein